jgi:undecaprenyl-diphosphatase
MDPTHTWQAALLGAIQGLTEFLPVSSSGHLIVSSWILEGKPLPLSLNVALHIGTTVAVLIYFWRDWLKLATAAFRRVFKGERSHEADYLLPGLVLGSIPAGVIGVLWEDQIEAAFHHPLSVAGPLAVVGILIWLADKKAPSHRELASLGFKDALLIGCAQACALIPGVSRSGATIMTGRLLSFTRQEAARFSFLLGTPAMGGAMLLKAKDIASSAGEPTFYIGIAVSFLTGVLAIGFLLRFLKRFGFGVFAVYRLALAGAILIASRSS